MKLGFILLFFAFSQALANDYTFEDLLALEEQKSYQEFFDHYKDIKPSQRKTDWKNLVSRMGELYATDLSRSLSIESTEMKQIQMLNQIEEVASNEIFQLRRKTLLTRFFTNCFNRQSFSECYSQLEKTVDIQNDQKELLFELGEILRKTMLTQTDLIQISYVDLWPFYQKALKDEMAEFYCQDEIQKTVVWNQLVQETAKQDITPNKFKISQIIHPTCWTKIRPTIAQKLLASGSHTRNEAYRILLLANDMTALERAQNALVYILNTNETGKLLDISWPELAKLKKDFELREKVIENLKKLDPLPGVVFDSYQDHRVSLVIKYVFDNVPEYIDLYSKTCINYMEGIGSFPQGNPTPYCRKLFEMAKSSNIIPKPVQDRYSKLSNFEFK